MDEATFREAAHTAVEQVIDYFRSIPDRRVTPTIAPGYLAPNLPTSAPTKPQAFKDVMDDIHAHIMPGLTHWQSPRFMAYFPAMTSFPSILGELYSAAFNAPAFSWLASPAITELETIVLDWLCQMLCLPTHFMSTSEQGGGAVLQSSASDSILVVMVAARDRYLRKSLLEQGLLERLDESPEQLLHREDAAAAIRSRLVVLGSEQSHSSTQKAANVLGLRYRTVEAPAATGYKITAAAVQSRIEDLRAQGLEPVYLTTTFGTTSTCAVDDIEDIANCCRTVAPDLWIHVDAAFAGAALILPEVREKYGPNMLAHVDSFNFNCHKALHVNFDASPLFVRNREHLIKALSITPAYLTNPERLKGLVTDYRDWQIPLGRRFRALKIWFVIRTYGVEAMQSMWRKHIELGVYFASLCECPTARHAGISIVTGPSFALTTIRIMKLSPDSRAAIDGLDRGANPADEINGFGSADPASNTASNELTKKVYEAVNARGNFFLTSSIVGSIYIIRVVSANERGNKEDVRKCFEEIVEQACSCRESSAAT